MAEKIITREMEESLRESFSVLKDDVNIHVFTKKGPNDQFNEVTVEIIKGIERASPKIKAHFHVIGDDASKKYDVERSPSILIEPEKYSIRYTGAPLGEEGRSLVMCIVMASTGKTVLTDDSRTRLSLLVEKRRVRVFVSPTCPYCPQQVTLAAAAAIDNPQYVSAEFVEIYENRDLAEKFNSMSVPKTFVNDTLTASGLEPEEYFISEVLEGKHVDFVAPTGREELLDLDVVILGGGPAGLTAAVYTERSGLKSVILEKNAVGGQITITPVVENYPGFARIEGKVLVDLMAQQAAQYTSIMQGVSGLNITKTSKGFEVATNRGTFRARALIIATGATHRSLDVPGENELAGMGVSYCATCDGYLFKDGRKVVVVGGGNSALTDALYLDSIGAKVSVIHRRDRFRAEDRLQKSLAERNIPVHYSSRVQEIIGKKKVEGVRLEDVNTAKTSTVECDAVFVSIGYVPNSEIAVKMGLKMDEMGYIKVDESQRTSMPFVYAAGDVAGGVKQIAVAAGQGSVAAIAAFEDLSKPYWGTRTKV